MSERLLRNSSTVARREFLLGTAAAMAMAVVATGRRACADEAHNEPLQKLLDTLLEHHLDTSPQLAVMLGRDSGSRPQARMRLDDETPDAQERRRRMTLESLAALRAFDTSRLSTRNRIEYEATLFGVHADSAARTHFTFGRVDKRVSPYVVSHVAGSYWDAPDYIANRPPPRDADEIAVCVSRLKDFARNLDGESERIRADMASGVVLPDFLLARTLTRMRLQQRKLADWDVIRSLGDSGMAARDTLEHAVMPGLNRQLELLESLRTRASHDAGMWRLKNGEACYAAAFRIGTAAETTVRDARRRGLAEAQDLNARADTLLRKIGLSSGPVAKRLHALASDERYLYPDSEAGKNRAVADMNARLGVIRPAMKPFFAQTATGRIEVRRLTRDEEAAGKVGYRVAPAFDGSRPGAYFVDLHAIRDRPTWSLPTVTYHETIPGHLLQLPLQEAAGLHPLRQLLSPRAYSEGWAIYAETLTQEIGVYRDDPLSEIGYLQSRLFRVSRLLADIGIHALRWSREQAVSTLMDMTAQPQALCVTDVDRYCALPGMIAGDEIGYYGWRAARERASRTQGRAFNLKSFHASGLAYGGLPQATLELATGGRGAG